jgi:hypothetical protein
MSKHRDRQHQAIRAPNAPTPDSGQTAMTDTDARTFYPHPDLADFRALWHILRLRVSIEALHSAFRDIPVAGRKISGALLISPAPENVP